MSFHKITYPSKNVGYIIPLLQLLDLGRGTWEPGTSANKEYLSFLIQYNPILFPNLIQSYSPNVTLKMLSSFTRKNRAWAVAQVSPNKKYGRLTGNPPKK